MSPAKPSSPKILSPKIFSKSRRLQHLYRIVDKSGRSVPFTLNAAQRSLHDSLQSDRRSQGRARTLILKARQLGMTTYGLIDALDECLFRSNQTIVITAHQQDKQELLFARIKYAYDHIPKQIATPAGIRTRPEPKYNTKSEMYFGESNSRLIVSLDARSLTPTRLHITELAFRDDALEMMTGTLPSLPAGADIIIESTAN